MPESLASGKVPALKFDALKLVNPDPSPTNPLVEVTVPAMVMEENLTELLNVAVEVYVGGVVNVGVEVTTTTLPESRASGTVPEPRLEAFKLVRAEPLPVNALPALLKVNALE